MVSKFKFFEVWDLKVEKYISQVAGFFQQPKREQKVVALN